MKHDISVLFMEFITLVISLAWYNNALLSAYFKTLAFNLFA
jgi:hypothetical protein